MKVTFPTKEQIREAAERLRGGELVAFPTETVYGLGAHALDARAVERIFEAKGRPRTSPLIVHVASVAAARELASEWPDAAQALALKFWPGPLTLVLPKRADVPDAVTAGLGSVGIRVPRHPVALELLREAAIPIAAPSANKFMRLSPTRAEHVREAFGTQVMVLEGGDSEVGIESTVISLAGPARLLRPGAVSRAQLEKVIGPVSAGEARESESPGLHARHYQPRTPLFWAGQALPGGPGAYVYISKERPAAQVVSMPQDPAGYASELYSLLHKLDADHLDWIAVEQLPEGDEWAAVRDRLDRATFRT